MWVESQPLLVFPVKVMALIGKDGGARELEWECEVDLEYCDCPETQ